jgi:hypothetical protein
MTLFLPPSCTAERDTVIESAIVADRGSFPNNNTHAVIDKKAPANFGARVNFYARNPTRKQR